MNKLFSEVGSPDEIATALEIAWLVGLFEGDGCFCALGDDPGDIRMAVKMTDQDVVQKAAAIMGAKVFGPYQNGPRGKKLTWAAILNGKKARRFMRRMLPEMCSRRAGKIRALLSRSGRSNGDPDD